ncbi:MAG: FAD binding domain-containing protein [Oscillospiraceae bacterium]|nr:FAD binding domain-containing protein [Oscillospiraceae bacterium]
MVKSFAPTTLAEALKLRKAHGLTLYTGGTDLMVEAKEDASYLFLHKIPELKEIKQDAQYIRFGAACTFSDLIDHPLTPKILKEACGQIAAPAIRNIGSIGGNIGNGSPKADSALIFMVTDSLVRLVCEDGERMLPLKEFYLGRKKLALRRDEIIAEVLIPRQNLDNYYYTKVGARNALAISRVAFAGILDVRDGVIRHCATAFGAVSDVILRPAEIDAMLTGKTLTQAKALRQDYLAAIDQVIVPIRGRVGVEYRKDVCLNLVRDFLDVNGI